MPSVAPRPIPKKFWNATFTSNGPGGPITTSTRGYDVTASQILQSRRQFAFDNYSNASLCDSSYHRPLFVTGISLDVGLAGSTAQSRMTRDFYPHSFLQPSLTVNGQCLDQQDYGGLCEFIHYVQREMMSISSQADLTSKLLQININSGSKSTQAARNAGNYDGTRTSGPSVTFNGKADSSNTNQIIRGTHRPVIAQGYVMSIPRLHEAGTYYPSYSFDFVITVLCKGSGPWSESVGTTVQQKTWVDLLHANTNIVTDAALKSQAAAVVQYAKQHAGNVISSSGA